MQPRSLVRRVSQGGASMLSMVLCLSLCILTVNAISVPPVLDTQLGILSETDGPHLCHPGIQQTTGYFNIDESSHKNYFYWYFPSESHPETAPVILWLTGGPGCSGEIAIFMENGPCMFNNTELISNPYSWTAIANVIYVDQPSGTGFSYSDESGIDKDENSVARDLNIFLRTFFTKHPEIAQNDFFIFAESYGGHYAPVTAWYVQQQNDFGALPRVNLKGVGIGNGLTDPLIQYQYYPEMIYNYTAVKLGHPLVSLDTYINMVTGMAPCLDLIKQCNAGDVSACGNAMELCSYTTMQPYQQTGRNVYDIRVPCEHPPLCYDMSGMTNLLNDPSVQEAIGVRMQWQSCNMTVNEGFRSDFMRGYEDKIPSLLEKDIRVMIYAGDCDYICNWIGNFHWTLALKWSGQMGFANAQDKPWYVPGITNSVATIREFQTFSFVKVLDAGHMVPHDQPYVSQELMRMFTRGLRNRDVL